MLNSNHIASLFTIAAICIGIYLSKNKISTTNSTFYSKLLGYFLLTDELLSFVWLALNDRWTISVGLPLHMCDVCIILLGIHLLHPRQVLHEITYFWGISGATLALFIPEFTIKNSMLWFINYYIFHGAIIFAALWSSLVLNMRPRKNILTRLILYSCLLVPTMSCLNWLLSTNYMYINYPPIKSSFFLLEPPLHLLLYLLATCISFKALDLAISKIDLSTPNCKS